MRRALLAATLLGVTLALAAPACFKPDHPACAFSCIDPPHTCPSGYACGADNLCHDPNNLGTCAIVVTGDGAAPDTDSPNDGGADRGQ